MKKSKYIDSIAKLLPEGLTETTIEEIANLVNEVITEQVEDQISNLTTKVSSYLRLQVDQIKEQALKELEIENEIYKNKVNFEDIKSLVSLNFTDKDEDNTTAKVVKENSNLITDLEFLAEKLNESLEVNENLNEAVKLLSRKNKKLQRESESLQESVSTLELKSEQPFKSSEKAIVISEMEEPVPFVDLRKKDQDKEKIYENKFLTKDVLKLL